MRGITSLSRVVLDGMRLSGIRWMSAAPAIPLVAEKTVSLTVIDVFGRRHKVVGFEGRSLLEVLADTPDLSKEYRLRGLQEGPCGADCGNCCLTVARDHLEMLPPPLENEVEALDRAFPERTPK
eukprot:jgi/Mesvir1/4544/Mv12438-RA.1